MLPICYLHLYSDDSSSFSACELEKLFMQYPRIEKIQPDCISKNSCFEEFCVQDLFVILFLFSLYFFGFYYNCIAIISEKFISCAF